MITNPNIIENKYACSKRIAEYLIFKCGIPLLGFDKEYYYFAETDKLKECVKDIPLGLKILSIVAGWIY